MEFKKVALQPFLVCRLFNILYNLNYVISSEKCQNVTFIFEQRGILFNSRHVDLSVKKEIEHLVTVVIKLLQTLDNHPLKWVHMHVNVAEIIFDASRRFSGSYTAKNDNLEKSLAGILTD